MFAGRQFRIGSLNMIAHKLSEILSSNQTNISRDVLEEVRHPDNHLPKTSILMSRIMTCIILYYSTYKWPCDFCTP